MEQQNPPNEKILFLLINSKFGLLAGIVDLLVSYSLP